MGKECELVCGLGETKSVMEFLPDDTNAIQEFPIQVEGLVDKMRIVFKSSTDFYGRITVYHLDVQ